MNKIFSCVRSIATIPLKAKEYGSRVAVIDSFGKHTYSDLYERSLRLSKHINSTTIQSFAGMPFAILCESNSNFVVASWAAWLCGGYIVPLFHEHPSSLLQYYISDSNSAMVLASSSLSHIADHLLIKPIYVDSVKETGKEKDFKLPKPKDDDKSLVLYTSGTTGMPKGVLHTNKSIESQILCMQKIWEWNKDDVILEVLPLHHVHGLVNCLLTPLHIGATCIMKNKFVVEEVWNSLLSKDPKVSVFMAVPTIYSKLIQHFDKQNYTDAEKKDVLDTFRQQMRLMVSGSASLPTPLFNRVHEITGYKLMEQYGSSELGRCFSTGLHDDRKPGYVGKPVLNAEVKLIDSDMKVILEGNSRDVKVLSGSKEEVSGELLVRGSSLFKEYIGKPAATADAFTEDGYFKTGDIAAYKDGLFKILGRASVDIIKSGGYKISALDVERVLLSHPNIQECAVVGVKDEVWGEQVTAVVVLNDKSKSLELEELRSFCKKELPKYSCPKALKILPEHLPRNAVGKINKKTLVAELFPDKV